MARKPRKHTSDAPKLRSSEQPLAEPSNPTSSSDALDQQRTVVSLFANVDVQRALLATIMAGLWSPLSQLCLSPVYGSVPSALYHKYGLTISVLAAFGLRGTLPRWVSKIIPAYCFWIPSLQYVLFRMSSYLGNPAGPLITEIVTYYPLIVLSIYVGIQNFDDHKLPQYNSAFADAAPAMGLFVLFTAVQRWAKEYVPSIVGSNLLNTRIGLQMILATLYGLLLPHSILWPAVPSIAFNMLANPHTPLQRTTIVLNNTLALHDYTLIDRRESITGYISVLEDNKKHFRVMRCDHSLLGGEWTHLPQQSTSKVARRVAEPIYAIFTMLEAVRLVEDVPVDPSPDSAKKALTIGLGIGTAPSALLAHGINTTILELDPVVHEFAVRYFGLPTNHSFYIGDAVAAIGNSNASHAGTYDYIIHDVFTGGAEPVDLFTIEFFEGLKMLVKDDGVVAINYAGDLSLPSAGFVWRTIHAVFPTCRVFREEAEEKVKLDQGGESDFTNLVFFCRKRENLEVRFRKAVDTDYLGSAARREFMVPQFEVNGDKFANVDGGVLRRGRTREMEKWQAKSAVGHWKVMRTVLPDYVWENW